MKRYDLVAMGGTFDIIHKGHIALLSKAFSISGNIIIGLTSDELAQKKGKKILNSYQQRFDNLKNKIEETFPKSRYQISKLDKDFGPAVFERSVQALVVSEETQHQGDVLNKIRIKSNVPPVDIITVPMELARDNVRISTTRIRNSEIDMEGRLLY
jgi:pantetheine-phosphate adenylyltransferase